MKKFDLPLWSDTAFLFFVLFLFLFCLFRFYIGPGAALAAAACTAAAAAVLFHFFKRARRKKRHEGEREREEAGKLAFHMAMSTAQENAALIAKCLNAEHADDGDDGETAREGAEEKGAEETARKEYASADGDRIQTRDGCAYVRFRFEKVTADELSPMIRAEGGHKTVLAGGFTDEAQKLAAAFGLTLKGAEEVYELVKESGNMPEKMIEPPVKKSGFVQKLRFRIRRDAWRGYLFAGAFLLLFSLITVFPVYYIVSGSVLLTAAVLIRFFGKKDDK